MPLISENSRERETLFAWLRWIVGYEAALSKDYPATSEAVHGWLTSHGQWPRISPEELEVVLTRIGPESGDTYAMRKWIYLPAPIRGIMRVFVANVDWDFTGSAPRIGVQVAGFWRDDLDAPRAGAWRFEGPEEAGPSGNVSHHGYFHAQPCRRLRTRTVEFPVGLDPADASLHDGPTFPLDAASCSDLIICLMVALYGRRQAAELVHGSDSLWLKGRLGTLRTLFPSGA